MTFHDEMETKADHIYELAGSSFSGIMYLRQGGTPWYSSFAAFTRTETASANHLIEQITSSLTALTRDTTGTLDLITDCVDSWVGDAADNFRVNYLAQLKDAIEMQEDALKALALLAEAHRDVVAQAQSDLRNIADQAINALTEAGDGGSDPVPVGLAVVGAVALVAAAAVSGGTSVLVLAAVEGTATVASAAYSSAQVGGAAPCDILASLVTAVELLADAVTQEERKIQSGLAAIVAFLTGPNRIEIRPPAPMIAGWPLVPMAGPDVKGWDLTDFSLPQAD